jgi:glycosidase
MIRLRQTHPEFINGNYQTLQNKNDYVLSFLRNEKDKAAIVIINFSNEEQQVMINSTNNKMKFQNAQQLWSSAKANVSAGTLSVNMPAYGIGVWELK